MSMLRKLSAPMMKLKGNISKGCVLTGFFKAVLLFAVVTLLGCTGSKEIWPEEVLNSLWVPKGAQVVERYHRGFYKLTYRLRVCYPAKDITDDMENLMTTKGWVRMPYDPLNPPPTLPDSSLGKWHQSFDKDNRSIYGRREFWEDKEKNVISYRFTYEPQKRNDIANNESCSLTGISTYTPGGLMHAIQEKIKEVDQHAAERARKELEERKK
jgi:hypothetical protein